MNTHRAKISVPFLSVIFSNTIPTREVFEVLNKLFEIEWANRK